MDDEGEKIKSLVITTMTLNNVAKRRISLISNKYFVQKPCS